jgi:hypothetical protein
MKNGVFWDGVTSQKTPFFIVIAVKTSNVTKMAYGQKYFPIF